MDLSASLLSSPGCDCGGCCCGGGSGLWYRPAAACPSSAAAVALLLSAAGNGLEAGGGSAVVSAPALYMRRAASIEQVDINKLLKTDLRHVAAMNYMLKMHPGSRQHGLAVAQGALRCFSRHKINTTCK